MSFSEVYLPAECPKCGTPLLQKFDTGEFYCPKCRFFEIFPQERETSGATSGTTIETTIYKQKRVIPQHRPTYDEFMKLKQEVEIIKDMISSFAPRVVIIEEKPKEQAKKEVEAYFKEHKKADIEELMLNLKIDIQTLVDIIDELKKEGIIGEREENYENS